MTCPLASLFAYFGLILWGTRVDEDLLMFWVGILLLVSAGSFLYVATIHILPEVFCNTDIHRPHEHHHLPEDHVHDEEHFSKPAELTAMVLGLLMPFFLMIMF